MKRLPLPPDVRSGPLILRAGRLAHCQGRTITVIDDAGVRSLDAPWDIDRCLLSADGAFATALGDEARRAVVWDSATGRQVAAFAGLEGRRHSLRIGVTTCGADPCALVAVWNQPISVVGLRNGQELSRVATIALVWFHVTNFIEFSSQWVGVQGYLDGEQYDSILAIPSAGMLSDTDALQAAVTDPVAVREWGYKIAAGPVGNSHAVFYRDPEWDDDDPPDDPAESFRGFVIWNLAEKRVEQRIAHKCDVASAGAIGGDGDRIAIATAGRVNLVRRATGETRSIEAIALDPYRLEIARIEADGIIIEEP